MDAETLTKFEAALRQVVPSLQVRFKDESWFQRALGVLVYPFNPNFMNGYVTTIGSTVYFGSRDQYLSTPDNSLNVLAHEFVHIWDARNDKLFKLKYLMPQALVGVPLLTFAILAGPSAWLLAIPILSYILGAILAPKSRLLFVVVLVAGLVATGVLGWLLVGWKMLALLGLGVVGPWPSPWRTAYELRGYGMGVALQQWLHGSVHPNTLDYFATQFTGPSYFYMCRDYGYVQHSLSATRQQAQVGALQRISPYSDVYDFLISHGIIQRPQIG